MTNINRILLRRQDAHSFTVTASSATFLIAVQRIHTLKALGTWSTGNPTTFCPCHTTDANATTVGSSTLRTALVVALGIDAFETIGTLQASESTTCFKAGHVDADTGTVGTATIGVTIIIGIVNTGQTQTGRAFETSNATTENLGAFANGRAPAKGTVIGWIVETNLTVFRVAVVAWG